MAVFAVTEHKRSEAEQVARIVRAAADRVGSVRLVVFGRGAELAAPWLRSALAGTKVHLDARGLLEADEASALLAQAHVQLFVRSGIAARRGTIVAGIACALPIVGWTDSETAFPVTEAGLRMASRGNEQELSALLAEVLGDATLRAELRERSRRAARDYFSWERISQRFAEELQLREKNSK